MTKIRRIPLDHRRIVLIAIVSRLVTLGLIIFFRSLASPYDTSASINPNCLSANITDNSEPEVILLPRIASALESSVVWDGVYFVRIAQCGYEYEQTYAFLPLLPLCMRLLSRFAFAPLIPVVGYRAVLALSGHVISNVAFAFAAVYLYRLSCLVLEDSEAACRASVFFCFNPASVFYSSVYSESLYSLGSFGGMYHLLTGANCIAVLMFALSGSARSNGVLNAGYFCFQALHVAYDAIFKKNNAYVAFARITLSALQTLCVFVPFIAFQAYGYFNICLGGQNELQPWCKATVPLLYDYIQSHYWGVGFLRYFELKQLPNFLLASPMLFLASCSIFKYLELRPEVVLSLGFQASKNEKECASIFYSGTEQGANGFQSTKGRSPITLKDAGSVRRRNQKIHEEVSETSGNPLPSGSNVHIPVRRGYASILILPFVLHLAFMSAVAFLVMHVQVATRFLSSSPPIYWFLSYLMASSGKGRRWTYLVWVYFISYVLLGSLLFSNFYPFT